jgi:hypothetical protein
VVRYDIQKIEVHCSIVRQDEQSIELTSSSVDSRVRIQVT